MFRLEVVRLQDTLDMLEVLRGRARALAQAQPGVPESDSQERLAAIDLSAQEAEGAIANLLSHLHAANDAFRS